MLKRGLRRVAWRNEFAVKPRTQSGNPVRPMGRRNSEPDGRAARVFVYPSAWFQGSRYGELTGSLVTGIKPLLAVGYKKNQDGKLDSLEVQQNDRPPGRHSFGHTPNVERICEGAPRHSQCQAHGGNSDHEDLCARSFSVIFTRWSQMTDQLSLCSKAMRAARLARAYASRSR
jgi:hypothetical protein